MIFAVSGSPVTLRSPAPAVASSNGVTLRPPSAVVQTPTVTLRPAGAATVQQAHYAPMATTVVRQQGGAAAAATAVSAATTIRHVNNVKRHVAAIYVTTSSCHLKKLCVA